MQTKIAQNALFWMLHHVALVRTDVSEEPETSVLTRATWCNIPEDGIHQSLPWKPQILQKQNS
jgi:hypothetical protein